jgi:hypothetical protein
MIEPQNDPIPPDDPEYESRENRSGMPPGYLGEDDPEYELVEHDTGFPPGFFDFDDDD